MNIKNIFATSIVISSLFGCNDAEDTSNRSSTSNSASASVSSSSSASSSLPAGVFTEYNDLSWEKSIKGSYETRWYRDQGFTAPFQSLIRLTENPEELSSSLNEWLTHAELYGFNRHEWQWMQRNLNEISWAIFDDLLDGFIEVIGSKYQIRDLYTDGIEVNVKLKSEDILTGAVIYSIHAEQELVPNECPNPETLECPTYLQIDADMHLSGMPGGGFPHGRRNLTLSDVVLNIRKFTIENSHVAFDLSNNSAALAFSGPLRVITFVDETSSNLTSVPTGSITPEDNFRPIFGVLRKPSIVSIEAQTGLASTISLYGTFQSRDLEIQGQLHGNFQDWHVEDLPDSEFNTTDSLKGPIEDSELTIKFEINPGL